MKAPTRQLWTRMGKVAVGLLAGLGALMVVATVTPLDYWWATKLAGPWNGPHGDILIILGAGSTEEGTMGPSSYLRAENGFRAFRDGGFREVVVSGGGNPPAALAMRDYLLSQGVPPQAIQVEAHSTSTRENALFCRALLENKAGRKVLLTSDYHMFRAYRTFRKAGIAVLPWPFPDVRKRELHLLQRWPAFLDLVLETTKIGYYWARGWL